jgi:pyridoxal phosphate enzyme (YggS family)
MSKIFNQIQEDLQRHKATLVAVSKTRSDEEILSIYDLGQRIFGENRVQALTEKYESLPKDIEWHLIGHLQKNKVKYIAPFVQMIHSIDSFELAEVVDKQAKKNNRVIDALIQVKVATESTKFGLDESHTSETIEKIKTLQNIRIRGLMGMASFTSDQVQVRSEFKHLKSIFDRLKENVFLNQDNFDVLSMGMSGDYKIALEEGSTMVRIGSLLFN